MNRGVFFTYPYLLCYEFISFTQHLQVQADPAQGFGDPNRQGNITATIMVHHNNRHNSTTKLLQGKNKR